MRTIWKKLVKNKGLGFPDNFMEIFGYKRVKNKIVACSGYAFSGKSTAAKIIRDWAEEKGLKAKIFSFAHALKEDLDPFCREKFGISAFTQEKRDKSCIRGLMIEYGSAQRKRSGGTFWWKKIEKEIQEFFKDGGSLALLDDLRFSLEFGNTDEHQFILDNNGTVVYVERKGVEPIHVSEKIDTTYIGTTADFKISWNGGEDEVARRTYCHEVISYLEKYYEK